MCVSPGVLRDGTEFACRKCWQCRENYVNDWVGRCLAESKTSVASHSVTLTYGRDMRQGGVDHAHAAVLFYEDFQKYLKLLRRHGFPVRYFAVGEYGSLKGRAHWHAMLWWQSERVPAHVLCERFIEAHWPHGWSYWDEPNERAIRYVMKYLQKGHGDPEKQGHMAMSKKPPLGAKYFSQLAAKYVDQGLSPQHLYYSFPDVRAPDGRPRRFFLQGVSRENFAWEFARQWRERYPDRWWPASEVIDEIIDPPSRDRPVDPAFSRSRATPFPPLWAAPCGLSFSLEPYGRYYRTDPDDTGRRWYWAHDLGGKLGWQRSILTEATAEVARAKLVESITSARGPYREFYIPKDFSTSPGRSRRKRR